jgi:hypothetical protein
MPAIIDLNKIGIVPCKIYIFDCCTDIKFYPVRYRESENVYTDIVENTWRLIV